MAVVAWKRGSPQEAERLRRRELSAFTAVRPREAERPSRHGPRRPWRPMRIFLARLVITRVTHADGLRASAS